MIALVEGAERQKTPNEIALNILLAGMTIVFLIAVVTLTGLGAYSGTNVSVPILVALFVTLIPTTIGGLLSAIGIAGMDRLLKFNVLAMSGRAVEAAGDVDTLLLDKTGTITFGNRHGDRDHPGARRLRARGGRGGAAGEPRADETPEGRSIVALAHEKYGVHGPRRRRPRRAVHPLLGARPGSRASILAAASCARARSTPSLKFASEASRPRRDQPAAFRAAVERIARSGGTPLGRRRGRPPARRHPPQGRGEARASRSASPSCAAWASSTVMITGDNPVTAAAIASEAGVDDFLAEATPEDKLRYIRDEQAQGPADRHVRRRHQRRARRSPRPTSASPCRPARRPRARPATWSTSIPTPPSSSRSSRSASRC